MGAFRTKTPERQAQQRVPAELPQDQSGREGGGEDRRDGDARYAEMEGGDKQQIERHIDGPGEQQRQKRRAAVSASAQRGGTEIIEQQERITGQVDPQIPLCSGKDIRRRPDQPEQRPRDALPGQEAGEADERCEKDGGPYDGGETLRLLFPDAACDQDICADRQTGRDRHDERDDLCVCTHRSQCGGITERADDRRICGVEQLLQHTAQRDRKGEQQKPAGQRAVQQFYGSGRAGHISSPPK